MRPEVEKLAALGPFPSEDSDDPFEELESCLNAIVRPVTDDEARALVGCFGPDDAYGSAWTLLTLIETAPGWPLWDCLQDLSQEWIVRLRDRAIRGGYTPGI